MKKKIKLSKKDLDFALKSLEQNDSDLYFSLGESLQHEYAPPQAVFLAPYEKMGFDFWLAFSSEIYHLLCNPDNKRPKDWVQELISGDIRNLIIGILTAITSTFHVELGIAIPVAALVIKKGLINYCKRKPRKEQNGRLELFLMKRKDQWKKNK